MAKSEQVNRNIEEAKPSKIQEEINAEYKSPTSSHFEHEGKEYALHQGNTYDLPVCDHVNNLIQQGRLIKTLKISPLQ